MYLRTKIGIISQKKVAATNFNKLNFIKMKFGE